MSDDKVQPLTEQQAAIVSAYTGYLVGSFADMHAYIEVKMGGPVWTHEMPALWESGKLREACKDDYLALVPLSARAQFEQIRKRRDEMGL